MPNVPLVSVVVPNYNHGRYVGDAIRSVLAQDYQSIEIIVVDDGSTDDSRHVIGEFGDRVRYVWQGNRGLSAARNTGIRLAAGTYIGVLDADDLYEPQFASTLVQQLEDHPEAGAITCGYRFVDEQNRPLPQVEVRRVPPDEMFQRLAEGNFLVPEAILVRRRCYQDVGPFDETLSALEDLDMWLRITARYRVLGSAAVLTRHRILPASMSTDPERQHLNRLRVIRKHFGAESSDVSLMTKAQRRVHGRGYLTSAVEQLQQGREARAADLVRDMARVAPELLVELETFYELGCGSQPKGFRSDFSTLDVQRNALVVERVLQDVLGVATGQDALSRAGSSRIWATAHFAIGLLHYGRREQPQARWRFLQAARNDPSRCLDFGFLAFLLKSHLPGNLIEALRETRRRWAPSIH